VQASATVCGALRYEEAAMFAAVGQGGTTEVVAAATVFAILATKLVDMLRNMFDAKAERPKWLWNAVALVLGVGMALLWKIDLLDNYSSTHVQWWAGRLLTGLAIGGTASGYHELFDSLSSSAKKLKASGQADQAKVAAKTPPGQPT
jgi:hypothetical protein